MIPPVVVYGGGPAALATALALAERDIAVDLVGPLPAWRWPVQEEGGMNGAGEPAQHLTDTLRAGGARVAHAPVAAMVNAAPSLLHWLARAGVPWQDGRRRLPGATAEHARFVEAQTARQVAMALERQLARRDGVRRLERHDLCALARDDAGAVRGVVVQDLFSREVVALDASAVVLATGGPLLGLGGRLGGPCPEVALAIAARAGALVRDADVVGASLASFAASGRRWLLSGALRAEGARAWVPLDAREARLGRDVPRREREGLAEDLDSTEEAAAAVAWRLLGEERGVFDRKARRNTPLFYLDASHLPEEHLRGRLASELDLYERLVRASPYREPLKVAPAAWGTLGGVSVDHATSAEGALAPDSPRNHATSVAGLWAVGGCTGLYRGGARLSGNELCADLFGARLAAGAVAIALDAARAADARATALEATRRDAERAFARLAEREDGAPEGGPATLHAEIRAALEAWALARTADGLREAAERVAAVRKRVERARAPRGQAVLLRSVDAMATVASILIASARTGAATAEGVVVRLDASGEVTQVGVAPRSVRAAADAALEPASPGGLDDDRALDVGDAGAPPLARAVEATDPVDPAPEPPPTEPRGRAAPDKRGPARLRVRVLRQDGPAASATRRWERFEIDRRPAMTVAEVLDAIAAGGERRAVPVAWDAACQPPACGACAMRVNGRAALACTTLVDDVSPGRRVLELAPLAKHPVLRDLVVERARLDRDVARMALHPRAGDGDSPAAAEPRETDRLRLELARCTRCACCIDACPSIHAEGAFVGAAAIAEARLADLSPDGAGERAGRLAALMAPDGIVACGQAQSCLEICPEEIPLDEALAAAARGTTLAWLRSLVGGGARG